MALPRLGRHRRQRQDRPPAPGNFRPSPVARLTRLEREHSANLGENVFFTIFHRQRTNRMHARFLKTRSLTLIHHPIGPTINPRTILIATKRGRAMHISPTSQANQLPSLSVLKSANQQPELAGELISKTIANLLSAQSVQATPQTASPSTAQSGASTLINTVA